MKDFNKMKDFNRVNPADKLKPADKRKSTKSAGPEGKAGEGRAGKAAAYIRFSDITFPLQCTGEDAQNAFLLELTKVRRIELRQMAARQEQRIDAWYEDLGCSGRGEFLTSRTQFEALTLAARTGKLSCIFAWDLSRLFRDLVQQELWLEEMEHLGVLVHIQDLPFAMDLPTRRLFRQELGMINEYHAARIGALFSAALHARVAEGLWVGRTRSQWGLRYNAEKKGFLLDEATAPCVRRLYALFNALGGSASMTVRTLNRAIEAGHPDALPPPRSRYWTSVGLLKQIRDPLYRRRTSYKETEYAVPHLIPEVILPQIVAATDALLAARQPVYEACAARWVTPPEPCLYARRLRCAACGGAIQAFPRQVVLPTPGRQVLWGCGDAGRGGLCTFRFQLPQYRLTAILDRGLREAFAAQREQFFAEDQALQEQRPQHQRPQGQWPQGQWPQGQWPQDAGRNNFSKTKGAAKKHVLCRSKEEAAADGDTKEAAKEDFQRERHRQMLRRVNNARIRCLESYAAGLTVDRQQIKERLAVLEARQALAEAALSKLPPVGARATPEGRWRWSEAGRLEARFEEVWPQDWWQVRDPAKTALLRDLDLTLWVHIAPKVQTVPEVQTVPKVQIVPAIKAPRVQRKRPYKPRREGGLCELMLSSPVFSLPVLHLLAEPRRRPITEGSPTTEGSPLAREPQSMELGELEAYETDQFKICETGRELLEYKLLLRPPKLA